MSQAGILSINGGSGVVTSATGTAPITINGVSGSAQTGAITIALVTPLTGQYGGTGVANTGKTITLSPFVSGQVLTSDGSGNATYQNIPAGGITTINGDTGSITGSTVTIYANNTGNNSGASVSFVNSGTVSTLNLTDSQGSVYLGNSCGGVNLGLNNTGVGVGAMSAHPGSGSSNNCAFGSDTLFSINGGGSNSAFGTSALFGLSNGTNNVAIGAGASQGVTSQSNTIGIGNPGTTPPSNGIVIGDFGTYTSCFVAGISGVTAVGSPVGVNNSTGQLSDLGFGTSGQYFGSNGSGTSPTWKTFASASVTIAGDTGSMSGSSLKIFTNVATQLTGATVKFVNSGTTSTLTLVDQINSNIAIGNSAGNASFGVTGTISRNVGMGTAVFFSAGANFAQNTALGDSCLSGCTGGILNTAIGFRAGLSYNANETSNILLVNSGTPGENHTIRIGVQGSTAGKQNRCFVAGILNTDSSGFSGPLPVFVDTSTGQLGYGASAATQRPVTNVNNAASPYTVLPTDSWIEVDSSGGAVTILLEDTPSTGRFLTIMDALGTSFTNNITVTTVSGTDLINGATSQVIAFNYQGNDYIFNATYWSMK